MDPSNYQLSYVALIDILGFTELVERSERNSETFNKVRLVTETLSGAVTALNRGLKIQGFKMRDVKGLKATAFSDTIVMSLVASSYAHNCDKRVIL